MARLKDGMLKILLLWNQPVLAFLLAALVYGSFSLLKGFEATEYNYFSYLADAYLHGQFHLRMTPPNIQDLVLVGERIYLYWLPMPAILMIPLVAVFGVATSDVVVTVLVGAVNVLLFGKLLQQAGKKQIHQLDSLRQAVMVIFFAFGTVHFTLAPYGKVWQLSQLVSLSFMLLAYLNVISLQGWRAFLFTGMALTGAMLTRSHLIFIGIWPAYILIRNHSEYGLKKLIGWLSLAGAPIVLGGVFILVQNQVRFGHPFEMGLQFHAMVNFFQADYRKYGFFNLFYVPRNLYYNFLYYPLLQVTDEWTMGGSLFLLSPLFFGVFFAFRGRMRQPSSVILAVTALIVYLPSLLLLGTGWATFGPRYTLDFIVPFLLLTAQGVEKWPLRIYLTLGLISVLHYVLGTYWVRLI